MRIAGSICAVAAAVTTALLAASASASVVSVETVEEWDGEPVLELHLTYTALVGEANRLRVEAQADGRLLISDFGAERIFEDEDLCEQVTPQQVACAQAPYESGDYLEELKIVLGDQGDVARIASTDLDGTPLPLTLDAGSGPDVLRVRAQKAAIYGRGGNDRITALDPRARRTGNSVSCGAGRDRAVVLRSFDNRRHDCERLVRRAP